MDNDTKYIDIKEFREKGFLQEANRLFFHPVGLALEVVQHEDGSETLGGIWDYRDDPEGITFSDDMIDPGKIVNVEDEYNMHRKARTKLLGDPIQGDTK